MDNQLRNQIQIECVALSNAFAYHLDHRNYQQLADLFTEDGVWTRHGAPLRGRTAIVEALEQRVSNQFTRHVTTGHYFTEIGIETAAATAYNMTYFSLDDTGVRPRPYLPEQAILLDFFDTYVKTPAGWRFATRITTPVLMPNSVRALFQHGEGNS